MSAPVPTPAAQHPRARHACPVAAVEDALLLIRTGRPGMAERVLAALPGLLLAAENERLLAENERLRGHAASLVLNEQLHSRVASLERALAELIQVSAP